MRQGDSERRKHARRTVLLPCRVESPTTSETMHLINLSEGGCLVACRGIAFPRGAQVTVHVKFEDVEIPLTGRVVHARDGWGFAVEFVNLTSDTRRHLEQFFAMQPTSS
jgi:PilZ domain-containing protein